MSAAQQQQLVLQALGQVLGGPRSLRCPPARALQALSLLAGTMGGATLRQVDDLWPVVQEGQQLAAGMEGLPAPVAFRPDPARQTEGMYKQLLQAMARLSQQHRIGTAPGLTAIASLVGQVSVRLLITEEQLRGLLQEGLDRGVTLAGEVQAGHARYEQDKRRQKGRRN